MSKLEEAVAGVIAVVAVVLAYRAWLVGMHAYDISHAIPGFVVLGSVGLYVARDRARVPDRGWAVLAVGAVLYVVTLVAAFFLDHM